MSERLESSTKIYGVPILISQHLWRSFSLKTKNHTRVVDWVKMDGFDDPIKLYTVDIKSSVIELEENKIVYMTPKEKNIKRI